MLRLLAVKNWEALVFITMIYFILLNAKTLQMKCRNKFLVNIPHKYLFRQLYIRCLVNMRCAKRYNLSIKEAGL